MTSTLEVAAGRLPVLGHAWQLRRRPLEFLRTLYSYGDVVRVDIGPIPVYVITDPDLIHRFLVVESTNVEKGRIFDKLRPVLGDSVVFTDGEEHIRQRRRMLPAFNRQRMPHYVELIRAETDATAAAWRPGQTVAADREMAGLALRIGVRALFSAPDIGGSTLHEAGRSVITLAEQLPRRTLSPRFLERWPVVGSRKFDAANIRLRGFIDDVIRSYRADRTDHNDLLSVLLTTGDDGTGGPLTDRSIADELVAFMIGANETMSATLAWLCHELGRNPDIDRRVHAEINEVLGGRPVRHEDIAALSYTRRVIQEVLRMYSVWIMMYRTRVALDLDGIRLPPGAEVVVSPYALHHDPRRYPDPERFDPDRWLPERSAQQNWRAFLPFGSGSHRCAGESFAWIEITTILATVLARWRLEPRPGRRVRAIATGSVHPNALPMTVLPRGA